jgi:hypothetical protein
MAWIIIPGQENKPCEHQNCVVLFDPVAARELSAYEVQTIWPRFDGQCPDCGVYLIKYASAEHYTFGDW